MTRSVSDRKRSKKAASNGKAFSASPAAAAKATRKGRSANRAQPAEAAKAESSKARKSAKKRSRSAERTDASTVALTRKLTRGRSPMKDAKASRAPQRVDKALTGESSEEEHTVRASKLNTDLDYDAAKNPWVKVLTRTNREMFKLKKEQHILQTFAARDSKTGPEAVRQTAEGQRSSDAIKRSKEAIRDCLRQCEQADAEAAIAAEHFDSDGEIDNAHIRCAACNDPNASDDNDILLCDGERCSRAYHVGCLPVKPTFDVEALPEDTGWLCPACDCRYDILWNLAETFELDYDELIPCAWDELLTEEDLIPEAVAEGAGTILGAQLASDDESDDEDFGESDSDGEDRAGAANGASKSAAKKARGDGAGSAAAADSSDEAGPSRPTAAKAGSSDDGAGKEGSEEGDDGSGEAGDSSECDSHAYVSDSDSDVDGGMARMLQLLEEDKDVPPEQLVISGKRQRTTVDYRKLNDEMFGDAECYDGEGVDDEFKMRASGTRRPRKRSS